MYCICEFKKLNLYFFKDKLQHLFRISDCFILRPLIKQSKTKKMRIKGAEPQQKCNYERKKNCFL